MENLKVWIHSVVTLTALTLIMMESFVASHFQGICHDNNNSNRSSINNM